MKKKVLAMFLAATMAMAMPVMVFPTQMAVVNADEKAPEFTMTFEEKGKVAHTYNVYQIFSGTYSENEKNEGVLSDIAWGSSIKHEAITINGKTYVEADAEKFANDLKGLTDAQLEGIRGEIFNAIDKSKAVKTFTSDAQSSVNVELPAGYYILEDVTPDEALENKETGSIDTRSSFIINLVGNVDVKAKVGSVTSEKKVDDINDSTGVKETLQDTADYDIGDSIPFTITGTIPANYDKYNTFYYTFHDKMEKGLTFNNDVKVYNGEAEIDSQYYTVNTAENEFTVEFADLKKVPGVTEQSVITVKYTSTLNEDAVVGSHGNVNESWLEYSNNPDTDSKGTTKKDNNIVFTYKVIVNKVDENKNSLSGAEFTIEKYENGAWKATDLKVNESKDQFTVTGIDDGVYRLTETKAPVGYNKLTKPYYFVVDSEHNFVGFIDEANRDKIMNLSATQSQDETQNFVKITNNAELQFTTIASEGAVSTDVQNVSGSTLPSTGGMGTTVFYLLGGVLVVGAGVVLFTRRRVDAE